jgi:pantoate--beta-alanine ligase
MKIIEYVSEMQQWSERERCNGRRIALVPTMGSLHEGHLSLVREGRKRADRLVVSLFVNPAQFGPHEDFAAYPRDFERDRRLLENENVDILFHPSSEEIYPNGYQTYVDVEKLSGLLCGARRPGHFRGVATVVAKLFNIVRPHLAIFGEKDFQQLQIIRRLSEDLNLNVEIVSHPIVRELDGLAMSSRNAYLNAHERRAALCLFRALRKARCLVNRDEGNRRAIIAAAIAEIEREPLAKIEYIELCDPVTLQEVNQITDRALLALAVQIGKARLIDNCMLELGEAGRHGKRIAE